MFTEASAATSIRAFRSTTSAWSTRAIGSSMRRQSSKCRILEAVRLPEADSMAKKRRKSGRPEMLSRNVVISSFSATVRLGAVHCKGENPYIEGEPWLELRGTATEGVRDV